MPDEEQTATTTPGSRGATLAAGTCPVCGRDELVTTTIDGKSATHCPLCGHTLDTAELKAAAAGKPKTTAKRSSAKRRPAKRASAKRSTAKKPGR